MESTDFLGVMPGSLVQRYQYLGGTFCPHLPELTLKSCFALWKPQIWTCFIFGLELIFICAHQWKYLSPLYEPIWVGTVPPVHLLAETVLSVYCILDGWNSSFCLLYTWWLNSSFCLLYTWWLKQFSLSTVRLMAETVLHSEMLCLKSWWQKTV
jgi:hypothetical protein